SVREATHHFRHEQDCSPREARLKTCREAARAVLGETDDPEQRVRLYRERTCGSRADFYRRKREVESGEFGTQEGTGPGAPGGSPCRPSAVAALQVEGGPSKRGHRRTTTMPTSSARSNQPDPASACLERRLGALVEELLAQLARERPRVRPEGRPRLARLA